MLFVWMGTTAAPSQSQVPFTHFRESEGKHGRNNGAILDKVVVSERHGR
jgi:hypothetical protein